MAHYDYQNRLHSLWEKAVLRYREGQRGAASFFDDTEVAWLGSLGLSAQEVYDYAEDFVNGGDPDFINMATVTDVRRAYFLEVQGGVPSGRKIALADLPAKDAQVAGLAWLPRLIVKARAKLRGEMPDELMYGCGGDRRFFRENDIHPAEFLRLVWAHGDRDQPVIDWVLARRAR